MVLAVIAPAGVWAREREGVELGEPAALRDGERLPLGDWLPRLRGVGGNNSKCCSLQHSLGQIEMTAGSGSWGEGVEHAPVQEGCFL